MYPSSFNKFLFFREFTLLVVLSVVTIISYMVLAGPVNSIYTLISGSITGEAQDAADFTTVMFGGGFVLLLLGLLAWGVGSAVRRGEDTATF